MGKCCQCGKETSTLSLEGLCSECKEDIDSIMYEVWEQEQEERKQSEAGVEIYSYNQIIKELDSAIDSVIDDIKDRLYEVGCKNKIYENEFKAKESGKLMSFRFKGDELSLSYKCETIVGERDEEVRCQLIFLINKNNKSRCIIAFDNSEYEETDNGVLPVKKAGINVSEVKDFLSDIYKIIK